MLIEFHLIYQRPVIAELVAIRWLRIEPYSITNLTFSTTLRPWNTAPDGRTYSDRQIYRYLERINFLSSRPLRFLPPISIPSIVLSPVISVQFFSRTCRSITPV